MNHPSRRTLGDISLKEEVHAVRAWIAEQGLTLPDDWQERLHEIRHGPALLSETERLDFARMTRTRRENAMLSMPECDKLIAWVNRAILRG